MYPFTPVWNVLCQLSILTIVYPNLGFNSSFLTLLVPISDSYRSSSYHTVLFKFHSLPFLKKCILLVQCLVCLVSLPFLAMQKPDLLYNIIRVACSGTKSVSLFNNSLFVILKCARAIPEVHAALYSLLALYLETGPVTCVQQ